MAIHRTGQEAWLLPSAVAFLVVAVLAAVAMLLWPGGSGGAHRAGPVLPTGVAASGVSRAPSPTGRPSPTAPAALAVHSANSGLCLDVKDDDPQGAAAVQQPCSGAARQHWRKVAGAGGAVALVNGASGLCLDVNGGSDDDGARVQQWACNGADNQLWRLADAGGRTVTIVSVHSGKCLDVPGRSKDAGKKLQQYRCNGTVAQQWTFS